MLKQIFISGSIVILLLSGCASKTGPEYDADSYSQIKKVQTGVVIKSRPVTIKDDGSGKVIGAIVGAVLGSTVGSNTGTRLATVGGALAGGVVGSEVGKANASELTIELDNGETVVVVAKVVNIVAGDRVRIIKDGNKAATVDLVH
ncbi:MAG: glycine zipper 2TM domain-containing protein [Helicobacteraceae bacterium]|nr:glycine zipper 2TM domain-containing protein [Candidatus Sulfurimonas ponti]